MACVEHAELSALHEQDGERKKLRESEAQSLRTTLMRVDAACSEGDADACEAIPEHEVDRHARCRAGDYDVCAQLGDLGDFEAAEAACGAGLTGKCHDYDATSNIKAFQARIAMRDACVRGDRNACAQMQKLTAPPCPK